MSSHAQRYANLKAVCAGNEELLDAGLSTLAPDLIGSIKIANKLLILAFNDNSAVTMFKRVGYITEDQEELTQLLYRLIEENPGTLSQTEVLNAFSISTAQNQS